MGFMRRNLYYIHFTELINSFFARNLLPNSKNAEDVLDYRLAIMRLRNLETIKVSYEGTEGFITTSITYITIYYNLRLLPLEKYNKVWQL